MSGVGLVNGIKVTRTSLVLFYPTLQSRPRLTFDSCTDAPADDPNRVVTVTAQAGKSGKETQIQYTNCKVVGNGSFGVVFAAKMLACPGEDGKEEPEQEIAIKKVLQDKRFKVGHKDWIEERIVC